MLLHMYKKLFPKITDEQLAATTNSNVQLEMYNKTPITQLGICIVEIEHKMISKN